jgi:trans-2,3-dihydro-3-hydroxyanthranilate isomerase
MIIYKKPIKTTVETARVFTKLGRNGNGLGVVTDARGLDAVKMQKIARILGFSETSFVFGAGRSKADYVVRFFTPKKEIPFAGHPSIGTLFILLKKGLLSPKKNYVQQIGARKVPLSLADDGRIYMDQGRPVFGREIPAGLSAKLLSLPEADVAGAGMAVSTGLPHLIIPLASKKALRKARIASSAYDKVRKEFGADCVMPFFAEGGAVFCRNFIPALGVAEDPATGSGCGPLACYIVRHGNMFKKGDGVVEVEVSQGIGRVSQLMARVRLKGRKIIGVDVGGHSSLGKRRLVSA